MAGVGHQRRLVIAAALAVTVGLGGCTGGSRWTDPGGKASGGPSSAAFQVTPAENATDVPVSEEIGWKLAGGKVTAVTLTDTAGAAVPGKLRDDGSSWVPASPLKYSTAYQASVTADTGGKQVKAGTKFTTMARPGNRLEAHVYMADNATYGQAMPVVLEFKQGGVKGAAGRAAVERRLFVTSDPPQPGVWHWDSDIQVEYRPKDYWQPGTKLDIRLGLGGLPIGDGRYGATDITVKAGIDTVRRVIEVDNASHSLTATQDGQAVKTAPVSLGRTDRPSFSGTMVVMERLDKTVFDSSTYGTPVNSADGYRTDIVFAERLTWDGQFIHAAPWSVGDQGKRNVSHGCVNVSVENGQWIYNWSKVGDPVVVKGTERRINQGNGFTAWDLSWDEFVAGSALKKAPSLSPSPSR
jgi:lipoprotein-anchoring transpeptidase ErfK/SrfK